MWHWHVSSTCNAALCGGRRPVCARVYEWPDSIARTAFLCLMDAAFDEPGHCRRVWLAWAVGDALRD